MSAPFSVEREEGPTYFRTKGLAFSHAKQAARRDTRGYAEVVGWKADAAGGMTIVENCWRFWSNGQVDLRVVDGKPCH